MYKKFSILMFLLFFLVIYPFSLSGFTWHTSCIDTVKGSGAYGTDIELDSLGYPHIIYKEIYDKGLMYVSWDGAQWLYEDISESLSVKGREKGTSGMISLELDSLGYPHISTCGPGYYYKDGAGWHLETGIDPGALGGQNYTSLRLDSLDYPHIAYHDGNGDSGRVKYAYYNGSIWDVYQVAYSDWGGIGVYGVSLALDSLDLPHIAYSLEYWDNKRCLGYAYKDTLEVWHKEYFDSSGVSWGHYVNIELDSLDRPLVAYGFGGGTTKLRFAKRDNGGWNTEWVDTVGYAGIADGLTLDSLDNPFIVYWANYWAKIAWNTGFGWEDEKIDSVTTDDGALVTSYGITIDRQGYIYISYTKSLGWYDNNSMWYATTHPTVGVEEKSPIESSVLNVPSIVFVKTLEISWNVNDSVDIGLYDVTGRKVKMIYTGLGRKRIKTDIDSLASGIYFLVLKSTESRTVKKITIIK